MPLTGAVGDIISVSLLVKDLLVALNGSQGSSSEYQAVVQELYILDIALLQVEHVSRSNTAELLTLYETINQIVARCRDSITEFRGHISKYSKSLEVGGSGSLAKDITRKIQWQTSQRNAVAKFRTEIMGYSESINMLLVVGATKLVNARSSSLNDQFTEHTRRMQAALDIHTNELRGIQALALELKGFMSRIISSNITIYHAVLALCSAFSNRIERPLLEDPFILEDAIGRIAPVHLRFINTWAAFQAVIETRFQGKQGSKKIYQKQYILQEDATGREIDTSLDFVDAFLPGQKIIMSIIFRKTEKSTQISTRCPRCGTISEQLTNINILCPTCNMWFSRTTEETHEINLPRQNSRDARVQFREPSLIQAQSEPDPLKVEGTDSEDDDYSGFKRIRIVSKVKASRRFRWRAPWIEEENAMAQQLRDQGLNWKTIVERVNERYNKSYNISCLQMRMARYRQRVRDSGLYPRSPSASQLLNITSLPRCHTETNIQPKFTADMLGQLAEEILNPKFNAHQIGAELQIS